MEEIPKNDFQERYRVELRESSISVFKDEVTLFYNIDKEENVPHSFYETTPEKE